MKPDWLKEKLSKLKVPEADPVAKSRALERALIALKHPQPELERRPRISWLWLPLGTVGLAVLMTLVCVLLFQSGERLAQARTAARDILNQFAATFPGQLEAVVQKNGETNVLLSDEKIEPSSQPVEILLQKGNERVRVLSYSGREVCVEIAGKKTCLEVLAQSNGQVIVSGERYLWSSENPATLEGYKLEASAL